MATTIETDLKEVLGKLDQRFDRLEQKLDRMDADLTTLKVDMATVKADLTTVKDDIKDIRGNQRSQIWALIITVIGATVAAIVRFGFLSNP
ncbi:MAG: hypothetical protein VKJ02_08460 [Snowella sp.]|nr:hypothetical protein [Snowella sp.]